MTDARHSQGVDAGAGSTPSDALALLDRICAWREDDKGGYDQAIGLLCEAEFALAAKDAEITALKEELKNDQTRSVMSAAVSEVRTILRSNNELRCTVQAQQEESCESTAQVQGLEKELIAERSARQQAEQERDALKAELDLVEPQLNNLMSALDHRKVPRTEHYQSSLDEPFKNHEVSVYYRTITYIAKLERTIQQLKADPARQALIAAARHPELIRETEREDAILSAACAWVATQQEK